MVQPPDMGLFMEDDDLLLRFGQPGRQENFGRTIPSTKGEGIWSAR